MWFFVRGAFEVYVSGPDGWQRVDHSRIVPEIDFDLLTEYALRTDQHEAVVAFRDRLRAGR